MGALNQEIKTLIEGFTFLSRDVLHVYGGVFFFLIWVVVFKNKHRIWCLLIIFGAAVMNEILDGLYYFEKSSRIYWKESFSDIFNTAFLPLALYFFLHYLFDKKPYW